MRYTCTGAALLMGAWLAVSPSLAQEQEVRDLIVRGAGIVEENCARCHAVGAEGESTHKDAPPFRIVVKRYPPETLAEALAEGISTGHPDMPVFTFEPDEIEAIIAYLGSLAGESPESEE